MLLLLHSYDQQLLLYSDIIKKLLPQFLTSVVTFLLTTGKVNLTTHFHFVCGPPHYYAVLYFLIFFLRSLQKGYTAPAES